MAREKFDTVTKTWLPVEEYDRVMASRRDAKARSALPSPMMMRDIEPYESVITGEMITSRSAHRDHLRQHGGIEMGNERPKPPTRSKSEIAAEARTRREQVKAAAREKGVDVV